MHSCDCPIWQNVKSRLDFNLSRYFIFCHIRRKCFLRGGPFDFWGGRGWKISKKNFLQSKEKKKKIMQHWTYNREKKYHAKESAQKKIPTCKSTDVLHFSIVSTGLQDFAFLSRHICLKEHGVNSGQHHRDSTAFGAYNIR